MSDMISDGIAWMKTKFASNVAQTVTYTAAAGGTLTLTAVTMGRTAYRQNDLESARSQLIRSDADFIFGPELLNFGAGQVEPQRGDRVTWNGEIYEVIPINGEPCFRKSDPYGKLIRVHTMRVG